MRISAVVVFAAVGLAASAADASISMTDVAVFSTDASGNAAGGQLWSTYASLPHGIWLSTGGQAINGDPNFNDRTIDFELTPGSHTFEMWGGPGNAFATSFTGMNLFFGDPASAGISVFAATTEDLPVNTPFQANSGVTFMAAGPNAPSAGSLSYTDGVTTVTLVDFFYANPDVFQDLGFAARSRITDGTWDFYGEFTLRVTEVPAPGAAGLLAVAGAAGARRRRG